MYIYSTHSSNRIAHTIDCWHIRNTDINFLNSFETKEDVILNGYRLCLHCTKADKIFNKYKRSVDKFCIKHNMKYHMLNDVVSITTPSSEWKLILSDDSDEFKLFHKNSAYSFSNFKQKDKSETRGYHFQKIKSSSVLKLLEYILGHDLYRRKDRYGSHLYTIDTDRIKSKRKINPRNYTRDLAD